MLVKEFEAAINQICAEKGVPPKTVIETTETAIAAAYRKDFGKPNQNIKAKFNPKTHTFKIFDVKEVVIDETEVQDPRKQILLSEAQKIKKKVKVGDEIKTKLSIPKGYGRIAAQTAKQVIIQKIREAERDVLYQNFKKREGELINGVIQRIEGNAIFIDLGQATGFLPPSEQVPGENYQINKRLKIYIKEVRESSRGPEIVLSRTHPEIMKILFALEVPEVNSGTVEIKKVAREAGSRSKIAVVSKEEDVDPIGACVGQRGSRVQAVINEINGEKIDIIEWSKDPMKFVSNALAPAKVLKVELEEKERRARVLVEPNQLSLAIGKGGQNVRLAAKLTDWRIDVRPLVLEPAPEKQEKKTKEEKSKEKKKVVSPVRPLVSYEVKKKTDKTTPPPSQKQKDKSPKKRVNPARSDGALNPVRDKTPRASADVSAHRISNGVDPTLSGNKDAGLYSSPPQGVGLSNGVKEKSKAKKDKGKI